MKTLTDRHIEPPATGLKLVLTVIVPASMPEDEALAALGAVKARSEGLSLVTGNRHYIDVDLVDVERGH